MTLFYYHFVLAIYKGENWKLLWLIQLYHDWHIEKAVVNGKIFRIADPIWGEFQSLLRISSFAYKMVIVDAVHVEIEAENINGEIDGEQGFQLLSKARRGNCSWLFLVLFYVVVAN